MNDIPTNRPGRLPDYNPDAEFAQLHPIQRGPSPIPEPHQRTERLTDRDKPMLTNTHYVDDNVVQFLVTVRNTDGQHPVDFNADVGLLRKALIDVSERNRLDIAVAGHRPLPVDHPFNQKRG